MTAIPKPLPQRIPGATIATAPEPDTCHLCRNRQHCDWHWAKRRISADDCACCYGRYSSCRNTLPEPRTLVETVEHLLNTLGLREPAQQRQQEERT